MQDEFVGTSFEELTSDEMINLQGSGDISPETTPTYFIFGAGIGVGMTIVVSIQNHGC